MLYLSRGQYVLSTFVVGHVNLEIFLPGLLGSWFLVCYADTIRAVGYGELQKTEAPHLEWGVTATGGALIIHVARY